MVRGATARLGWGWFSLPVLCLKLSREKGRQQCQKSDCSCQLMWKCTWQTSEGEEVVSQGECEPLPTATDTRATTSRAQVRELPYNPPRVDSNAAFQHLVMYFNASSVTTEILTSAGNVQPCWVSWGTGAGVGLLLTQSHLFSSRERCFSCWNCVLSQQGLHATWEAACFNCTVRSALFTCVYLCVCTLSNGGGMEMVSWVVSGTLLDSTISNSSLDLCELTFTGRTNSLITCTLIWSVAYTFWDLRDFKACRALAGISLSNGSRVHEELWHVYNCIVPSAFAIWARHGAGVVRHDHFYQTYIWKLPVASLFCFMCCWVLFCFFLMFLTLPTTMPVAPSPIRSNGLLFACP